MNLPTQNSPIATQAETLKDEKNKVTNELILDYLKASNIHLDENQIKQFITISMLYGLNPFKREIYAVAYKDRKTGKTNLSIVTGYETYLKRAELNPNFDGYETKINGTFSKKTIKGYGYEKQIISPDSDNLSCTCTVFRKDRNHHISSTVFFDEYVQKNQMWETKPRTMIEKVSIVSAFRKAFPNDFGGIPYISDELPKEMGFNEKEKMQDAIEVNDYNNAVKEEVKEEPKKPAPKANKKSEKEATEAFIKMMRELEKDDAYTIYHVLGDNNFSADFEKIPVEFRRTAYKLCKKALDEIQQAEESRLEGEPEVLNTGDDLFGENPNDMPTQAFLNSCKIWQEKDPELFEVFIAEAGITDLNQIKPSDRLNFLNDYKKYFKNYEINSKR